MRLDLGERVHPARDDDRDRRGAGGVHGCEQFQLHAGRIEECRVACLPDGRVGRQPGSPCQAHDRHVGCGGRCHGGGDPGAVLPGHVTAVCVFDLYLGTEQRSTQPGDRSDDVGQVLARCERAARRSRCRVGNQGRDVGTAVQDLDVGGVVVVALEQTGIVGSGTDHGDRRQRSRVERQRVVVGQEDERLLRGATGE